MALRGGEVRRVAPTPQHMGRWRGSKSALWPNSWTGGGAFQSINSLKNLLTWLSQQTSPSASFHHFIPGETSWSSGNPTVADRGGFFVLPTHESPNQIQL